MSTIANSFIGSESRDDNRKMLGYLEHQLDTGSPLARYVNYWCNPHWSFFYYFPPDDAEEPYSWDLMDDAAPSSLYWIPARTQHLRQPALPPGENRKTRTDLVSAPLAEGGLSGWIQAVAFGQPTSWWGINKFACDTVPLTGTLIYTPSSSGLWTAAGASLAFATSGITVTPSSSLVMVDLDIGSFSSTPYMRPHLAYKWKLGYNSNDVGNTQFQLLGWDSASVTLLASGSSGTLSDTYGWPEKRETVKYAGTWGQDFGCLYTSDDIGTDTKPTGVSTTLMGLNENQYALSLLPGYTASKLRYVFAVPSGSGSIRIDWPEFIMPTSKPYFLYETGQTGALLREKASGIRWGQWSQWDYLTDTWLDTPEVLNFGSQTTTLDWLGFKRLALLGVPAASGIDAELASLYDSHEGQSRYQAAYYTTSFVREVDDMLAGFFTNTMAELPPLCHFPLLARNASYTTNSSSYAQESFSYAHEPRYLIASDNEANIYSPAGDKWTAPYGPTVPGWHIVAHKHPVENNEGSTFIAATSTSSGDRLAMLSPWHGYMASLSASGIEAQPYLLHESIGQYHRVSITGISSGDIVYRRSDTTVPLPAFSSVTKITSSNDCSWPKMDIDNYTRRVHILYTRGASSLYGAYSDDWGESFSSETLIASGAKYPLIAQNRLGDMVQGWWSSDGSINLRVQVRGASGFAASFKPSETVSGSPIMVASTGFGLHGGRDYQNRWWLTAIRNDDLTVSTWFSCDDCQTWQELGSGYSAGSDKTEARVAVSFRGDLIRAWREGDKIYSQLLSTGDYDWTAPRVVKDQDGIEIEIEENGWGMMAWGRSYQDLLSLTLLVRGESKISDWASWDNGETFHRVN